MTTTPPRSTKRRRFRFIDDTVFRLLLAWLAKEEAAIAWVETWPTGERRLGFVTHAGTVVSFRLGDALVRAGAVNEDEAP